MIDPYELGRDIGSLFLKFKKKKPMEEKHFEPVTARSLAEKSYTIAITQYVNNNSRGQAIRDIEASIDSHIRKPSDGMMADSAWVTGGMKSVSARCEEAYNEAIRLLKECKKYTPFLPPHNEIEEFLKKPNPFKEADIVKGEIPQSIARIAFDLELAKQGKKVVTKKGDNVKIVADDLTGNFPLLAVVTTGGVKFSCKYSIDGTTESQSLDMDLFILKEPEMIDIHIFRDVITGEYSTSAYSSSEQHGEKLIKTITVTI